MPTNTSTAGPDGDTNWQWDPEEDNVELLKQQQQQGGGGHPEAYSDQSKSTGIYALIRSPGKQTGTSAGKPQQPVAITTTVAQRRESAGPAPPSADDLFAELGMEARPNFHKDGGSPGRGSGGSTTRSSRLSAAAVGTSPVKSAGAGFAPGWIDDEDLDL